MLRVIIVDDEPMSVKRFSGLLAKTGMVTLAAAYTNPEAALKNAVIDGAAVAFIDIEMPGMNGLELTEKLQEVNPMLDVVMVTAHDHYALEAYRAHAIGYLLKPVSLDEVARQLELIRLRREAHKPPETPPVLSIRSFGRFRCHTGEDSPVYFNWRTAKARELLAFLHHHQGKPVSRDVILDTLWPEMDLDRAVKNFHATSYYLRESLKERNLANCFERLNGAYRLRMDLVDSDEAAFEQQKQLMGTTENQLDRNKRIAAIYQGAYCEEDDYPWAEEKRTRYEQEYLEALRGLIDDLLEKKELKEAAQILRCLLQVDPYEEKNHEKLMDIFIMQDNWPAVRAHYQYVKELFFQDLGETPSKSLRDKIAHFQAKQEK
ncbi:response regulator [Anoxynatronum buryatiense]|uniref:Stage 0 sporulation protein A homolog n=1 Tax=Anoxynatronum buryatiense TaxID=489973 RepID=A0AA46AJP0_9CLOT|nr:response regulator [Anoxynatronum buryatiense]SMP61875.1 Two-component response regulator, SAPR family, consists of REC, wHTH and BTAD domains [Anoxynatronum buryatiense]